MRRLTVLMPFHTPFYAPLAAGVGLGHFRDEGLDVSTMPAAAFGKGTIPALLDGDIEISLGGLMRSFELADRSGPIVVHFAEVCSRNGFFLLSREPRPAFQWSDLIGKTVLSFAEAPTPWQCMLTVLRRHGVDPGAGPDRAGAPGARRGRRVPGRARRLPRAAAAGRGAADLPKAPAHLVASMGEATGPVPFTSYMTTPEFLTREPDVMLRFTRGVYRTQRWLAQRGAPEIAAAIAPSFRDIEPEILEASVARYLAAGDVGPGSASAAGRLRLPAGDPARGAASSRGGSATRFS